MIKFNLLFVYFFTVSLHCLENSRFDVMLTQDPLHTVSVRSLRTQCIIEPILGSNVKKLALICVRGTRLINQTKLRLYMHLSEILLSLTKTIFVLLPNLLIKMLSIIVVFIMNTAGSRIKP